MLSTVLATAVFYIKDRRVRLIERIAFPTFLARIGVHVALHYGRQGLFLPCSSVLLTETCQLLPTIFVESELFGMHVFGRPPRELGFLDHVVSADLFFRVELLGK